MSPKGQEMDDHYFGTIKTKVKNFMTELNTELWKLGVLSKTEHNEAAPAQHELAPIFTTTNIATDHNQITMELMQRIAKKHDLVCLLHEKPFEGVNGSGKHNNWSISTNFGTNLLEPGDTPHENAQFLIFLCAVIKAVDEYQDLLRISVASAGNDHRLGAHEAPPAVVSIFLGEELTEILEAIEKGTSYDAKEKSVLKVGVHVLPRFPKDTTDRNRTSPFAFTGNKFEFRMLGSQASVSEPNVVINTAVAEVLRQFADELENAKDFNRTLNKLIKKTIKEHKRIIFNGNGYDDAWIAEAEKRGLSNYKTTPECLPHFVDEKNVKLFETHKVYTETEMHSRLEILLDNYAKVLNIEARTMADMVKRDILPAISAFSGKLAADCVAKKAAVKGVDCSYEEEIVAKLSELSSAMYKQNNKLEESVANVKKTAENAQHLADGYRDEVIPVMNTLRLLTDEAEVLTERKCWPYPTYADLLFGVK